MHESFGQLYLAHRTIEFFGLEEILFTNNLVPSVQTSHVTRFLYFTCFFISKQYFLDTFTDIVGSHLFYFSLQAQSVFVRKHSFHWQGSDVFRQSARNTTCPYWSTTRDTSLFVFQFVKVSPNIFPSNSMFMIAQAQIIRIILTR